MHFFSNHRRALEIGVISAAALLIGGLVWLWWVNPETRGDQSPLPPAAPTPTNGDGVLASLPKYSGESVGTLHADPVFLKQVSPETYQQSLSELNGLEAELVRDPGQTALWMRVAFVKRFYNDDAGARDAYEYLNLIVPFDPIPFYNVAVIYGYSLKEPDKAIAKYRTALRLDPQKSSFYVGFADFYRDVKQDLRTAESVLMDGRQALPGDSTILVALGLIYRLSGEITKAIEAYEFAYRFTQGAAERAAITAELERLRAK